MICPKSLCGLHLLLFSLLQLHWLPLRYLNTAGTLLSLVPAGHAWLTPSPPSGLYANVTFSARAFLTTLLKTVSHGPLGLLYFIFLLNPNHHLPCTEFYLVF